MESSANIFKRARPYLAMILLQVGFSGMNVMSKNALNKGMSEHVMVVYRHAFATIAIAPFALVFDRKARPKMTTSIFIKILLLGLLEPTIDQNFYYTSMKYTTSTFTAAMYNMVPAFAFLMAWVFRLEKVNIRKMHSQAKIMGIIVTVGGAMVMTLVKGAVLDLPWTKGHNQQASTSAITKQEPVKGAIMIAIGCICWAGFVNLQAVTLESYPVELSLTALICLMGTIEGGVFAVLMERGNLSAWSIHWDSKLLVVAYSGIICSGIAYYVQGVVMKTRGPVFVTAFSPLSMIIVAILSSFILSETMYLGRVIGAIVIVVGLYLVLWGKSKDPSPSISNNTKAAPSDTQMAVTIEERTDSSNQQRITADVTSERFNSESV